MKILISDSLAQRGVDLLRSVPEFEVEFKPGLSVEKLKRAIVDTEALVIRSATKVTADIIEAAPRLRVIGRAGIDLDNVDIPAASKRGIVVMNTPEGNVITTAERTIAMLMALSRNIHQATTSMKAGRWEKKRFLGQEVFHKTLGIIGIGRIPNTSFIRYTCYRMRKTRVFIVVLSHRAIWFGHELQIVVRIIGVGKCLAIMRIQFSQTSFGVIGKRKRMP